MLTSRPVLLDGIKCDFQISGLDELIVTDPKVYLRTRLFFFGGGGGVKETSLKGHNSEFKLETAKNNKCINELHKKEYRERSAAGGFMR